MQIIIYFFFNKQLKYLLLLNEFYFNSIWTWKIIWKFYINGLIFLFVFVFISFKNFSFFVSFETLLFIKVHSFISRTDGCLSFFFILNNKYRCNFSYCYTRNIPFILHNVCFKHFIDRRRTFVEIITYNNISSYWFNSVASNINVQIYTIFILH